MAAKDLWTTDPRDALRVGPDFDLASFDRNGQPGWDGDKEDGEAYLPERGEEMSDLQERLFAEGREGGTRSVLLVLQGLDTAGKGGIVRHVMGMVDPQGVALASFGVPTEEERAHHYLWRIEKKLPPAGRIGVFDRSHYEDVLVVRVDELVPEDVWRARYDEINAWEKKLVEGGTTIIKVALMVSYAEQGERLMERLERPDKHWKFNPGDLDTRSKWPAFQEAYSDVFRLTSTDHAPWYVVPADKKWYSRLAITEILTRTLEDLDPQWPVADFDVEEMKKALLATGEDAPA
ncbi:polyphosphate kinase 2 family protein [Propioniciclava sp. MC1595]|uniref:polyphosphate kinase 2 family protein n=1 Tax=Propioniciclava sp. MC1595 TaxID=2760308 RepID=UPI0016628531|nr:polyphosphate kinase 2 family protein [Propioniciclava sp. MC1595]MBB1493812.1 polyphosphate kinase 2 family protein [Propioniciclava sp. MC1595]NLE17104.1 polyphosphate kinase 2 family protein [Propioniciclava sp.]QTE24990.1 polyphosphate kinase 2 family protein [Propioniciclava sp. MC1595]